MKILRSLFALPLLLVLVAAPVFAGIQDEATTALDGIEKKLIGLAEAMPEDKLGWSPMEGVRPASAVFMHVAGANYFFGGRFLGAEMPSDVKPQELEKTVKTQSDIVSHLEKSMSFAKEAISSVSDEELDEEIDLFGRKTTKRAAILLIVEHASEHLGQAIAYARMNKVVPPWSQ